jgi:hypothetical protein
MLDKVNGALAFMTPLCAKARHFTKREDRPKGV